MFNENNRRINQITNINKEFKKIPLLEILKKRLLAYSKIDCIMCPNDEWLKVYYYDKNWIPNGHFFKIDDSGGDHYYIIFSKDGCIIKGFDHECELSAFNYDKTEVMPEIITEHDFYISTPQELEKLLDDPSLEKSAVTFFAWQSKGETQWHFEPIKIPDSWNDGIATFMHYTLDLPEYKKWFEDDYYESILDFDVLEKIYNGDAITSDIIKKLNPEADIEFVLKDLAGLY